MAGLAKQLGEPLWLGLAMERARAFDGPHAARARSLAAAARRRAFAARSLTSDEQDVAALRLSHEAAALALAALAATRGELDEPLPNASALWAAVATDLPGRPPSFDAARALLATDDLLAFDALPDPRRARLTLAPTLAWLLALAEPRTRRQLVLARVARLLGFGATVAGLSWLVLWLLVWPANEALYKPVAISSLGRGSASADALTDGAEGGRVCSTGRQGQPWVRVDLLNSAAIDSVRVHVRSETSLPLVLEVSDDDRKFREVSVRHEPVATGRWRVSLGKQRARFVRVRHPGEGSLALSEIEVWGWR